MTENQQMSVPASRVTLLDIYTRQIEMDGKLNVIGEQLKAIPDHEMRIRALEAFRWKMAAIAFLISLLSGLFSGYGVYLTSHH